MQQQSNISYSTFWSHMVLFSGNCTLQDRIEETNSHINTSNYQIFCLVGCFISQQSVSGWFLTFLLWSHNRPENVTKICPIIHVYMTNFRHRDKICMYFMKVNVSCNAQMVLFIVICHTVSHEKNFNLANF